jgi:iron complex outermembrane receptor protein
MLCVVSPAYARAAAGSAATDEAAPRPSTAESGGGTLTEIVVTAQRRSQRLTEVPISMQAVDGATLSRSGISSSVEFLKLTPSVNFVSGFTPAATSVTIRGISSIAQEGGVQPSTAIVVDDVPLAKQGEFLSDFNDVERVEILRGPQGTLFGKNATAGVVSIVNRKPSDVYEGSIEGGYSTDEEKLVRGIVNIPFGEKVRTRFNAFYRDLPGTIENRASLYNGARYKDANGEKTYGFAGKVAADLGDSADLLLSADYFRQRSSFGANIILQPDTLPFLAVTQQAAGVVADPDHPFVVSDNPSYSTVRGYGVSLTLNADLAEGLSVHSTTAYRDYFYDANTDADGGPWGGWQGVGFIPAPFYPAVYIVTPNGGIPRAPDGTRYWSEELKVNYSNDRLDFVGGAYIQLLTNKRHNSVPYILYFFGGSGYLNNSIDSKISDDVYSAFGDLTYRLAPTLSIFGGLRYTIEKLSVNYHRDSWFGQPTDTFDPVALAPTTAPDQVVAFDLDKTQRNLSGRAGLRFAPDAQHSYYASYSRGYKGPAVDVSRVSVAANAFLKPEIANSFEVGTKHILFDNRATANLAVFHQTVKDIQQAALIPGTTTARLQNAGDLRSYGVEFDLTAQATSALRLDAGLAYVHAEYRDFFNACYVGQTAAQGCVNGIQDETGVRAITQPRFSGSFAAVYNVTLPDSVPFDMFFRAGVIYKSRTPYGLNNDPLLVQPRHALIDAQVGLTGRDNRWQLLLYVKNLTNKAYASQLQEADNFIGRVFANYGRDYKRYAGATLKASF